MPLRQRDIRQRMLDVPAPLRTVLDRALVARQFLQCLERFIERDPPAGGAVKNTPGTLRRRSRAGQQVGRDDVVDIREIPPLVAGAEDGGPCSLKHMLDEFRQHPAIRRVGSLPRPEDVEIAQTDGLQPIHLPIAAHVIFAGKLLHRIRRNRHGAHRFLARQDRLVPIRGGGCRVDDPPDARCPRSFEHMKRSVHIAPMAWLRILHR